MIDKKIIINSTLLLNNKSNIFLYLLISNRLNFKGRGLRAVLYLPPEI
jgi:hypothetical protein